jgi:hypothetical protein
LLHTKHSIYDTDNYDLDVVTKDLLIGYNKVYTDSGIVFKNNIFKHWVGGMLLRGGFSTVEDLCKFARNLPEGNGGASYVKLMTSPSLSKLTK